MAKYKIVATGPVAFTTGLERMWIRAAFPDCNRIISVAGVPWRDIPDMHNGPFGRYYGDAIEMVAVRPDLRLDDFEVEIIDG